MATCAQCHVEFVPSPTCSQVYCRRSCKERARYERRQAPVRVARQVAREAALRVEAAKSRERTCAQCGNAFLGRFRSPFCSDACKRTRQEQARSARRAERIAAKPRCAEDGCPKDARTRGFCPAHYQKRCRPNRSHGAVGIVEWKRLYPERSAISDKNKDHRRRAKLHNAPSEPIDRQRVGERDGWRCGICRRKIDPALASPHPKSQSLDHIEPLSRGGAHTYANVRIAHLKCNVDRSNVFDHEQLALFG